MSVKEDLDKKFARQREDAAALLAQSAPADPSAVDLKDYPNAKAAVRTRNGSVIVTY